MENSQKFNYTYSAKEQEEIKAIRKKYITQDKKGTDEDKITQLRRLDAAVTKKATNISLILGIIGTLIMGTGMSIVMTDIGKMLGLHQTYAMAIGIGIGVIGVVIVCIAYPIYNQIVKKERKKIAPEIIRLSNELLKQENL